MFRVYLAGKMGGRLGREVLAERELAVNLCEEADITPLDPAANEDIQPDKLVDLKMDYLMMKAFVAKDEYAIRSAHALLILTGDTPSEGTGLEFGLALELGIPVVVVSPKRARGELMGFWNIKASAVFATVEEAVDFIAVNYAEV
jgi:nucleoside 2-deoxyribosyltransferase